MGGKLVDLDVVVALGDRVAVHLEPAAGSVPEIFSGNEDVLIIGTGPIGVVPTTWSMVKTGYLR